MAEHSYQSIFRELFARKCDGANDRRGEFGFADAILA
jgi:hypothetical protein